MHLLGYKIINMSFQLSIVVPLYNEQETFPFLIERLNKLMQSNPSIKIEVVLIDDGSKDNTSMLMAQLAYMDDRYQCVFLSRNFGHQLALSAGLECARGSEAIMVIDGDLQDPPELLTQFYNYYLQGYDVVYAIRKNRKESRLKRLAYHVFYRLQRRVTNVDIPIDAGDFSLISRRVVDILNKMPEESRFIRGLRSWIGFKHIGIEYDRDERKAGNTKYSISQLITLAYNGIFNFSDFPIKLITRLGFFTVMIGVIYFILTLLKKFFWGVVPEGFTALLFAIVLFSGVQLISLGIIGEYVYRIFFQTKNRPLFIIKERIVEKQKLNE